MWDELAETWRKLPDKALLEIGACGPTWSAKDVMNHVAVWQEAALRVIPDLMRGRKATAGHGTDTFNAIHHAEDRDRPLAASKRRLNRARRALLALIAQVPEVRLLDLNDRIGWWVKYSTYGHYAEHIYALTEWRRKLGARGWESDGRVSQFQTRNS